MTPRAPLLRMSRRRASPSAPLEVLRDLDARGAPRRVRRARRPLGLRQDDAAEPLLGLARARPRGRSTRPERVRMVYQQDGLFPWLTVGENIALGLRHVPDAAERGRRADALLDAHRADRRSPAHYPHQLSGGMRQRVELARALGRRHRPAADGRAVLVARLPDAPADARGAGAAAARAAAHGRARDARHRGGGAARRPRAGAVGAAGARARRGAARRCRGRATPRTPRSCARCTGS